MSEKLIDLKIEEKNIDCITMITYIWNVRFCTFHRILVLEFAKISEDHK